MNENGIPNTAEFQDNRERAAESLQRNVDSVIKLRDVSRNLDKKTYKHVGPMLGPLLNKLDEILEYAETEDALSLGQRLARSKSNDSTIENFSAKLRTMAEDAFSKFEEAGVHITHEDIFN